MHLCDCAWPTAEKDAARVPCGCRIYDVGSPYICPTHYRPPRITPPDLTTELADRLVDRANELLDEGSSDAAE